MMHIRGINWIFVNHFLNSFNFFLIQASSEHPLAKAILQYARHFHFFDESSLTNGSQNDANELKPGWLYDASDFSAIPGKGVQCIIDGQRVLVMCFLPSLYVCHYL